MKSSQYYIQSVEVDLEPNISGIDFGGASIDFEVDDEPEYDSEIGGLIFESNLELGLRRFPTAFQEADVDDDEDDIGLIDYEILIFVEGTQEEFDPYLSEWRENGYREMDWDLRYHIESGITTELFSPIAQLVNNSFRGVLPALAFSEIPSSSEEETELPISKTDFLRKYLATNIQETIIEFLRDLDGVEFDADDVIVNVSEDFQDIEFHTPQGLSDEFDQDKLSDRIESVYEKVIEEEANEPFELGNVEMVLVDDSADSE